MSVDIVESVNNAIKHSESHGDEGPWHITCNPTDHIDEIDAWGETINLHYDPQIQKGQILIESEFGYLQRTKGKV